MRIDKNTSEGVPYSAILRARRQISENVISKSGEGHRAALPVEDRYRSKRNRLGQFGANKRTIDNADLDRFKENRNFEGECNKKIEGAIIATSPILPQST